ncbi:macrolide-specific efflux system membrane fusion protein [Actinocorallia herbida]|uniref:Macrolide-specific efflux system membrane fusion protein n=1 Tax=Actinocorallia herbida TaxID=58109 RepID=A0A3N1D5L8_9ACTN|nr:efflux RND transporter periplasmic adaptor subunit [Actinocorallia herbida]ROO88832.1 macrolide-specific efflux system membrane fusion protein [Actinocorallia herbida]
MKFDKTTAAALGVLGVLLAGGLTGCSGDGDGADAAEPAASASASASPAAPADAAAEGTVSASGTVESARVTSLSFATGGIIADVDTKAGRKVAKGDLLATVDATVPTESLNAAYTAYVAAQDSYADAEKDQKKQLYASMIQARNTYRKAQREVDGTKIYAPFSGTVTSVTAVVDAEASAGSAMITLTDMKDLRVTADFTEADAILLKAGQKASITFDSLGKTVKGKVTTVAPTPVSAESTTAGGGGFQQSSTTVVRYEVLVSLSSLPAKIRTGMPVTVEVTTG